MEFRNDWLQEVASECDFTDEFVSPIEGTFELDGLTASDIQRINQRIRSSSKQQEIRQGKSRKVASQIFSG